MSQNGRQGSPQISGMPRCEAQSGIQTPANGKALEIRGLVAGYGPIEVLHGIDLAVYEGEVVTLLGGNAAGKTTTMRCITRLVRPMKGDILYRGMSLKGLNPSEIVRLGIASVPEGRRVFPRMTVLENLEMGAFCRDDKGEISSDLESIFVLFPRLKERRRQTAGTLSGGEQQMLAMGRAMMARPSMLLLDEPSMGLAPVLVERVFETIKAINSQGTTILLVEQNAHMALSIADRGYVIQTGNMVLEDTGERLLNNRSLQEAYLGGHD